MSQQEKPKYDSQNRRKTVQKLDINTIIEEGAVLDTATPVIYPKERKLSKRRLTKDSIIFRSFSSRLYSIDLGDSFDKNKPFDIMIDGTEDIRDLDDVIEESDDENADYPDIPVSCIIIDCTPISYIDSVGVQTLYQVIF